MHAGQVIATPRLGKLTKKATHYHPFDENCAHLVTQLSCAHEVRYRGAGRRGKRAWSHGPSDLESIEKRTVQCRIRNRKSIISDPPPPTHKINYRYVNYIT